MKGKKLGTFEKLGMLMFFNANKDRPDILLKQYLREPEKWNALKEEYPDWKEWVNRYPEIRNYFIKAGVAV